MNEYDEMEEIWELLNKAQEKLEKLPSKDAKWNKELRSEIDVWGNVLTL